MNLQAKSARVNALCPIHSVRFELKDNSVVSCNATSHILGTGYPTSDKLWEFCPNCLTVWPFQGRSGATRCLFCESEIRRKRLCSRCSVISLSLKEGNVPVVCPGCFAQDGQPLEHDCVEAGRFLTSRSECPFCKSDLVSLTPNPSVVAATADAAAVPPVAPPASEPATRRIKGARPDPRSAVQPQPVIVSAPVPAPAVPSTNHTRVRVIIAMVGVAVAALLYAILGPRSFPQRIDEALAGRRYFAPPGQSVYDIYIEEAKNNPGSEQVRAAGTKIRAALEPAAQAEIDRFYRDSVTELKWDELERYYAFLSALAPESRDIQVRLAYAEGQRKLSKDRDHRGALDAYWRALRLDPKFALALNGIAKVYVQDSSPLRDEAMAVHYYQRASEADPSFTWPLKNLGEYHMRRGEWEIADTYMSRALTTSPERPSILMSLGRIRFNQQRYRDARDYYTRARPRVTSGDDLRRIDSALEQIRQKLDD
ncbi:MAG TPA: tetratricopeptide repeat protein [Thermoanaerobaculia bacterium]